MATLAPVAEPGRYPRELERGLVLRGGTRLRMRPIRPDDAVPLMRFHAGLSRETRYHRFFRMLPQLPAETARRLTDVDYVTRLALVVEHEGPGGSDLIAVARYEPSGRPDTAEVAFVVDDAWQGRGLGTVLLGALLDAAAARGIARFLAYVLADNRRMIDMLERFTDVEEKSTTAGVVEIFFTRHRHAELPLAS